MEIERTECLERILTLPRRKPVPPPGLVEQMTELLRTPHGKQTLRPLQALALHDIGTLGGAFLPLDVGEGKTLISFLAPYVLDAQRPLLLLPANMIRETSMKMREASEHWLVPSNIRMMSYQSLGLVEYEHEILKYNPDCILVDECQRLKNRDAAVTRRVKRYLDAHPDVEVIAMTGTIMKRSLRDFAHILRWALKSGAPVPLTDAEVDMWALALDANIENEFQRVEPGALLHLIDTDDHHHIDPQIAARRAFRVRLRETPGVVASSPTGTEVDVDLEIRALKYDVAPQTEKAFDALRNLKQLPDGRDLWEASEVYQHALELALGFYQVWDPPPPEPWREARKAWFQFVRGVLQRSHTWDSPEHVAMACDMGKLPKERLEAWRAIKDTFVPNPVPYWIDDSTLAVCAEWMKTPGIVWVEHVPFGKRLAEYTGCKYYGEKGLANDGEFIINAPNNRSIIASSDANREGRNLQYKWRRNLVVTPMAGADSWQQLLGRTHRPGQEHDVEVDVLLGCMEHAKAWQKACAGALTIRDTVGAENKLLIADVDWPDADEVASWSGPRWGK